MIVKEFNLNVKTYQCAPHGYLGMHSIMQQLQEAASLHAEELGLGEKWLIENRNIWILSDMKIGINKLPTWKDDVKIFTWPSGNDTLRAYREFIAQGSDGTELFKASSAWMVLSMAKKMPCMMRDVLKDIRINTKRNFPDMERLRPPKKGKFIMDLKVPYHSIDSNGHVNNTEYVKWSIDAAHESGIQIRNIKTIQATFSAEVFHGQELEILETDLEDGSKMISIIRKEDGKKVFLFEIGF